MKVVGGELHVEVARVGLTNGLVEVLDSFVGFGELCLGDPKGDPGLHVIRRSGQGGLILLYGLLILALLVQYPPQVVEEPGVVGRDGKAGVEVGLGKSPLLLGGVALAAVEPWTRICGIQGNRVG